MFRRIVGAGLAVLLAALVLPARPAAAEDPILRLTQYENAATGKCIDIVDRGDINGSPAVQDTCLWSIGFKEEIVPRKFRHYFLVIPGIVAKCLEVENFSTANGAGVAQHDCNGGPHQQWYEAPSGFTGDSALAQWLFPTVMLQNVYSGKCLEIAGNSSEIGARIVQNDCYRGLNQLWFTNGFDA